MAYYFFIGPYDKGEIGRILEGLDFEKRIWRLFDHKVTQYTLYDEAFIINFTDPTKGYFQIQGSGPEDIYEKCENSKHFSMLERLAEVLHPVKIMDDTPKEVFSELVKKTKALE